MTTLPAARAGARGFTLIELVVSISILGIFMGLIVPIVVQTQRLAESEIALQKALRALRSEVEVLHLVPDQNLLPGQTVPFADFAASLPELAGGRGEILARNDPARPGLIVITVTVFWDDPWKGPSSVHTVMYRNAGGRP